MPRSRKLHEMHAMFDVCARCGLDAYDAAVQNCLTDAELKERAEHRAEAAKAVAAFVRTRRQDEDNAFAGVARQSPPPSGLDADIQAPKF